MAKLAQRATAALKTQLTLVSSHLNGFMAKVLLQRMPPIAGRCTYFVRVHSPSCFRFGRPAILDPQSMADVASHLPQFVAQGTIVTRQGAMICYAPAYDPNHRGAAFRRSRFSRRLLAGLHTNSGATASADVEQDQRRSLRNRRQRRERR